MCIQWTRVQYSVVITRLSPMTVPWLMYEPVVLSANGRTRKGYPHTPSGFLNGFTRFGKMTHEDFQKPEHFHPWTLIHLFHNSSVHVMYSRVSGQCLYTIATLIITTTHEHTSHWYHTTWIQTPESGLWNTVNCLRPWSVKLLPCGCKSLHVLKS